jgi:hypothetical protein
MEDINIELYLSQTASFSAKINLDETQNGKILDERVNSKLFVY